MSQVDLISSVIETVKRSNPTNRVVVGFDGYIDTIKKVVRHRDTLSVKHYDTLIDFGEKVKMASSFSAQLEMETQMVKIGGNGPIMASALSSFGISVACIGALGFPEIKDLFKELAPQVLSIGNPASTDALEFSDGKLILSDLTHFQEIDWYCFRDRIGIQNLLDVVQEASSIAFVGLSNLPHALNILQKFRETLMDHNLHDRDTHYFFDLADPSRLADDQLFDLLQTIISYKGCGTVTIGLNANEANYIYRKLFDTPTSTIRTVVEHLFTKLQPHELLVHPIDESILVNSAGYFKQKGRLVPQPKVLTGAGDNLNAGYCLSKLLGFEEESRLILSMACSGAYIAIGRSPSRSELLDYLSLWRAELNKEINA